MDKLPLKIQCLRGAAMPAYASKGAAAFDLCAAVDKPLTVPAGARALIPSGIAIELPSSGYVALVFARSGLAVKKGLMLANGVGVVDSDYRGEILVGMLNTSDVDCEILPGERIAQLAVMPVCVCELIRTDELGKTDRGAGGFGSTGRL
jgi:dUTP pyrophosphatase